MTNPLFIAAAKGNDAELKDLIEALKAQPDLYQKLALFFFVNDPQNPVSETLRSNLSRRLAQPNVTDFNWDFILFDGQSLLNLLTQDAYVSETFRPALSLLLDHSIERWDWNNHAKHEGASPWFWIMVSIYCGYIKPEVITRFCQPHFEWNIPNKENETALFWYVFTLLQKYEEIKNTVPLVLNRANLNWLMTVTDNTNKNGTSPLSMLIEAGFYQEALNDHIHPILDLLFETEPNFPTFWDDMLKIYRKPEYITKAKDLLRTNRGRKTYQPLQQFNPDFESFFDRLRSARTTPIGRKLVNYITEKTRNDLLDFLIPSDNKKQGPFNVDTTIMYLHLNALKPGESYRIPKEFWGLDRTMNILRSAEGEYQLIVETKSKLSAHTVSIPKKNKGNERQGSYKVGKPAWRIDNGESKYFHLICKSNKNEIIEATKTEAELSQVLGKQTKHINKYQQGLLRHKKNTQQLELFALGAKGSIYDLKSWFIKRGEKSLYIFILDLLRACKVIHQNGKVHQDISLKNVLLMLEKRNPYLALSDFGALREIGQKQDNKKTTFGFESPELEAFYTEYHYRYIYPSFARSIYLDANFRKEIEDLKSLDPNPANDVWSIGVIAYIMLNQWQHPTVNDIPKIQANELLKGMLAIKRSDRITIDQAIALCEKKLNDLKDSKTQPPLLSQFTLEQQSASISKSAGESSRKRQAKSPVDDQGLSSRTQMRRFN